MLATGGGLFAVIALVLLNAVFVAAEYSLVTVRRSRVEQMLAEGRAGARNVSDAVHNIDSYLAACQIGITVAALSLGWVGEPALAHLFEPLTGIVGGHALASTLAFLVVTSLEVVAGELAPRGLALQHPERLALVLAGPIRLVRAGLRPVIWVLNEGGWGLLRLIGVQRATGHQSHIEAEELRLIVQASAEVGAIEAGEQFLLERVLRFGNLTVAEIMIPRTEVIALPASATPAEAAAVAREHHFSRYPVYGKDIDDLVGVLHVRDVVLDQAATSVRPLVRDPLIVPSHIRLDALLAAMRTRRNHFAIAVDEFGGIDGIATLEDVLEAIVGDVADEYTLSHEPRRGTGGRIRIDGLENIDTLPQLIGIAVEPGPYHTVAGYVLDRIGRIPEVGDSVDLGEYRLTVVEMDDLRIAAIEAQPRPRTREAAEA